MKCPTPRKTRSRSRLIAAIRAAKHDAKTGDITEPYHCPCGAWHTRNVGKRRTGPTEEK